MSDSYHIDLREISLDQYKQTLKNVDLIPSRRILKEQIDERFSSLKAAGIGTLAELLAATKNAAKIGELARNTGLSVDYITILRREVNALLPNPKNLRDYPGIKSGTVVKLAKVGIKNSRQLFESSQKGEQRAELARAAAIDPDELLELLKLSDLSRVYGVGPIFARLLYDAGVDSVEALARGDASLLFDRLAKAYLAAGNRRVDFKERDIAFCIQMAKRLPGSIEY
jgi:hypothetical protein